MVEDFGTITRVIQYDEFYVCEHCNAMHCLLITIQSTPEPKFYENLKNFQSRLHLPNRCLHWPAGSAAPRQPDHNRYHQNQDKQLTINNKQ